MVRMETPVCDFGKPAIDFKLQGVDGKTWTLKDCAGPHGLLVMFICNHCPYVQAVRDRIVRDTRELLAHGVKSVAIMSNDTHDYPDDSFANMQKLAKQLQFPFPYLLDEDQSVAKAYGAVCTPDFFGYNQQLELQYRGRLDASGRTPGPIDAERELFAAMKTISHEARGPDRQIASIGCSIKWKIDAN